MKPVEIIAIISALAAQIITGLFMVKNTRLMKKMEMEQQINDLKAETNRRFDQHDGLMQQMIGEQKKTNGSIIVLKDWKEQHGKDFVELKTKVDYLGKK